MRTWIIPCCLVIFCFVLPLQFFIIGNGTGMGIQGALYRYQITTQGNSLIPITNEISYVTDGLYTGRSAFSVFFWVLGTFILVITTIFTLIQGDRFTLKQIRIVTIGLAGAGIGYLASCVTQYGPLLNGPAGFSIPAGVFLIFTFSGFLQYSNTGTFTTE
jgi:hypothetical protein